MVGKHTKEPCYGLTNYGPVDEVFTRISKKLGIDIFEDEDAEPKEPDEYYEDYPEERPVKTGFLYKAHGSYRCSRRN